MLRILLVLLVACLTTPAVAAPACHAPARVEATAHGGHHVPADAPEKRTTPAHLCIGCVPPDARRNAVAVRAPAAEPQPVVGLTAQLAGRSIAPAIPPPRS